MGEWNGSCIFSGLPITTDDDIVVFPNIKNKLTLIPFYGKYDGYGTIENIETNELTKIIVKKIFLNISRNKNIPKFRKLKRLNKIISDASIIPLEGKLKDEYLLLNEQYVNFNKKHNHKVYLNNEVNIYNEYDLMHAIERESCCGDYISVYDKYNGWQPLTHVMVHRKVWDYMKDYFLNNIQYGYKKGEDIFKEIILFDINYYNMIDYDFKNNTDQIKDLFVFDSLCKLLRRDITLTPQIGSPTKSYEAIIKLCDITKDIAKDNIY